MTPLAASLITSGAQGLIGAGAGLLTKNNYKKDPSYQRLNTLSKTFDKEIQSPYMEGSNAKSLLAALRENSKQRLRRVTASQALSGGTNESKLAAINQSNAADTAALSKMAGNADIYKSNMLQQKRMLISDMFNIRNNIQGRAAQNIQNVMQPLGSASSSWLTQYAKNYNQ